MKNQLNPKNLSKEFTLSSPNTKNRSKPLTKTEQNQKENKTLTKPLNKTYLIENANQANDLPPKMELKVK